MQKSRSSTAAEGGIPSNIYLSDMLHLRGIFAMLVPKATSLDTSQGALEFVGDLKCRGEKIKDSFRYRIII